ncbi:MAG: hypothetical protein HQ517_14895 [SAR324 cluster bacterium]|nr:hypothetical protein [SAR324 cluster bacterium]
MKSLQSDLLIPDRRRFIKGMAGLAITMAIPGCAKSTTVTADPRSARKVNASPNFRDGVFHNTVPTSISKPEAGFLKTSWRWMTEEIEHGAPLQELEAIG